MDDLVHGEEQAMYGDQAYSSAARQQEYESRGVDWCVNRKGGPGKRLTARERARNRRLSRVRAVGEHAFCVVKHLWGYRKVRYKGLTKNACQVFSMFALANLYLVRKDLMEA